MLVKPGDRTYLGATAEGSIMPCHVNGWCVTHKYLAGEIQANPAMLQPSLHDAALIDGALATTRLPQLVSAAAANLVEVGITIAAITTADRCQCASLAASLVHSGALHLAPPSGEPALCADFRYGEIRPDLIR